MQISSVLWGSGGAGEVLDESSGSGEVLLEPEGSGDSKGSEVVLDKSE